jgi:phosphoribosylglycinamide formyltransferase-1
VTPRVPVAVFASGGGTNLQALLDHEMVSNAYRIALVLSNRADAGALDRARAAGRDAVVGSSDGRSQQEDGAEMLHDLEKRGVQVIALAGYLKLIPPAVVSRFRRRILNIHPALLPAFGGKGMYGRRVHEAVLAKGVELTGATVHYVAEEYDTGTIIAQGPVPILPGDDTDSVAARVLKVEHKLYPEVLDHICRAVAGDRDPGPFAPVQADSESV